MRPRNRNTGIRKSAGTMFTTPSSTGPQVVDRSKWGEGRNNPFRSISADRAETPNPSPTESFGGGGISAPSTGGQISEPVPGVGGVTPGAVERRLGVPPASLQMADPIQQRPSMALKQNTPNLLGVAPGSFNAPMARIQEILSQRARR